MTLVRAGSRGDQPLFRKTAEAIIAEERAKQHNVLADRLVSNLETAVAEAARPTHNGAAPGASAVHELEPKRRLADLILPELAEQACRELIEEQHRAELLRSHGIEPRNRILLAGPPGNGKTSLAEALATELMVPFLVVRYEGLIASYLGETALRMAKLFQFVRTRRCVLFFDEFDVVGKERGDVHETGEIKRVVSSLLIQIDALPSYVVVVTATNHAELLDRAVWRRFQLRLDLPAPTSAHAERWLSRFEERAGFSLGRSCKALARDLAGLSFAELEEFGADVQRRYVLTLPDANPAAIVRERLAHWQGRFSPKDSQ